MGWGRAETGPPPRLAGCWEGGVGVGVGVGAGAGAGAEAQVRASPPTPTPIPALGRVQCMG